MKLIVNPPTPWPNWQAPVSTRNLADHHGARGGGWTSSLPRVRFLCRRQRGRLWVDCTHSYVRTQNCVELGARLLQMNGMRGASVLAVSALMAVVVMMATTAIVAYGGVKAAIAVRFFLTTLCYWFVDFLPWRRRRSQSPARFSMVWTAYHSKSYHAPGRARCCRQQGRPFYLH